MTVYLWPSDMPTIEAAAARIAQTLIVEILAAGDQPVTGG